MIFLRKLNLIKRTFEITNFDVYRGINFMEKILNYDLHTFLNLSARKWSLLCLFLYVLFVFVGQYITGVSIELKMWVLLLFLFGAVIVVVVTDKISRCVLRMDTSKKGTGKELTIWFAVCFVCTFVCLLTCYYALFPGAFSPDSNNQLYQATSGGYSDWHPFIHTFLFFTVPMKLFNAEEMIVFLQIMYFSIALAYLIMTIRKYGCPRNICVLGIAIVLLSPVTGNILMYPWKDCGLAIFSMVSMAYYINIILSQGEWLQKKRNMVLCSLFLVLTMLVRHNAVLFILPMMAAVLILGWKKYKRQVFLAIIIFAAILFFIKVPVYRIFRVEKPDNLVRETMGMCMVVMGNVVKNCPEKLDNEVREFLYDVSPKDVWEETYETGDFNSVKWHSETDVTLIEEAGRGKILRYTLSTFRASKMYSLQAFLQLTGMVWRLDGDLNWWIGGSADTEKTDLVLDTERQAEIRRMLEDWRIFVDKSVLKYPMNYIGWFNLALIALAIAGIQKKRDGVKIFHALPLLCYNFGTALLLTGFDWRFFYLNFPLIIPTLFLLVKSTQEETE